MQKVLVLGAGLVARPLVRYLLDQPNIQLKVASRTVSKAENLIEKHPRGIAQALNVENSDELSKVVADANIVISLLPWIHHLKVAKLCIEYNKHLVTTSYVKPEMRALDAEAQRRGLLFLNEIGVDPGIDHMAAMKIIHTAQKAGGKIMSFYSYCGGLPALPANNNPLGYKFSWSPVGVMLAATNSGRYLKDGQIVEVPGEKLFEHYWFLEVPGAGVYEAYVNRDALPYIDLYDIKSTRSMFRGTLRNVGHCETWNYFKKLGLLNQELKFDFRKVTPRQVIAELVKSTPKNVIPDLALFLNIPEHSVTIQKMTWLGLLSEQHLPLTEGSVFDMFAHILQEKLVFAEGEQDLLLQHHEFIVEYPNNKKEKITSTMVDVGIPHGDTSMSRTVALPAAIATKLMVNDVIKLKGVHIPVLPEIYEPVLAELKTMHIDLIERKYSL
ncbi:saccharopine dehydrogenase NADP-binding domain-containing protein [candidate division KSB1 bacterium]|nr:saccharopine dehydrogenase NADP-binding domain-containing protein [candidate division KSB1 bacterium]